MWPFGKTTVDGEEWIEQAVDVGLLNYAAESDLGAELVHQQTDSVDVLHREHPDDNRIKVRAYPISSPGSGVYSSAVVSEESEESELARLLTGADSYE